jgi:hypothetical protein
MAVTVVIVSATNGLPWWDEGFEPALLWWRGGEGGSNSSISLKLWYVVAEGRSMAGGLWLCSLLFQPGKRKAEVIDTEPGRPSTMGGSESRLIQSSARACRSICGPPVVSRGVMQQRAGEESRGGYKSAGTADLAWRLRANRREAGVPKMGGLAE